MSDELIPAVVWQLANLARTALRSGTPPAEVIEGLTDGGVTPELARALVDEVQRREFS